jgi:hypothetical protein
MAGLEGAASVVAFISLAMQTFEACVECYKLCETATHMSRDGPVLNSRFAFERMRLEHWAQRMARMGLSLDVKHDDHPHWHIIQDLLQHQHDIVRQAARLCEKYLSEGELKSLRGPVTATTSDKDGELSTSSMVKTIRQRIVTSRARQVGQSIRKAMTWAMADKERLEKILEEVGKRNCLLEGYLAVKEREDTRHQLDAIASALLYQCNDTVELDMVQQIVNSPNASLIAAAEVKKIRLALNIDKRVDELTPSTTSEEMAIRHYTESRMAIDFSRQPRGIQATHYKDQMIVVEWRTIDANWAGVEEPLKRLAKLLSSASNAAFHSLPCTGFIHLPDLGRFGFVYDVTSFATTLDPPLTSRLLCHSLSEMLSGSRFVALTERMRMAYNIAEAVTQLHTSGWLHKGICSSHVRFLTAEGALPKDIVKSSTYLVGYGYAREDMGYSAWSTEIPSEGHNADIYRHPNARSGPGKQPFRKRFDMYSLACLLVELALWKNLKDIFAQYDLEKEAAKREAMGSSLHPAGLAVPSLLELVSNFDFQDELSHHVCASYTEAIELCLSIKESAVDSGNGMKYRLDYTTLVETEVLSKLKPFAN